MALAPIDTDLHEMALIASEQELAVEPACRARGAVGDAAEDRGTIGAARRYRRTLEIGVAVTFDQLFHRSQFVREFGRYDRAGAALWHAPAAVIHLHRDHE